MIALFVTVFSVLGVVDMSLGRFHILHLSVLQSSLYLVVNFLYANHRSLLS